MRHSIEPIYLDEEYNIKNIANDLYIVKKLLYGLNRNLNEEFKDLENQIKKLENEISNLKQ